MALSIDIDHLNAIVKNTSFKNDGDHHEIQFGHQIIERFPNSEEFWRLFVVPMTNRIKPGIEKSNTSRIRKRTDVANDLYEIAILHYSVFIKLIYAYDHLNNLKASSFEEFYAHLASCCDIVEEFLLQVYLLRNECTGNESETLQRLSKKKFLDLARQWYNDNYPNAYTHYLNKGKFMSMPLPGRANLLDEYFEKSQDWKAYKSFTSKIRQYRNVLIHSAIVGKMWTPDGRQVFVPKKESIVKYKKLIDVLEAAEKLDRVEYDFVDMHSQMTEDINTIQDLTNQLWEKPIKEMTQLLFTDKNEELLQKYGLEIK